MTENSSDKITTRNFSTIFEQMCNFIAVAKTGDSRATVRGLVTLCLLEFPKDYLDTADSFRKMIETLFGLAIPNTQIEEALNTLERDGMISRPAGANYKLSREESNKLSQRVQESKDLEKRVKSAWFEHLKVAYPKLPPDEVWNAIRSYLSRIFRRHGIQAAALLDPTVDTSPEYEASLATIQSNVIKENIPQTLYSEAKRALADFMALVGTDNDRYNYVIQLADGAFNFYTLAIPVDLAEKLRTELSQLTLFLDTNFLFGIMDLTYNANVEISNDLLRAISVHNFPFKLRYHEATKREMDQTIYYYESILRSRSWTQSLSRAASRSRNLTGIEQKFHERNSTESIDVDEFLRPFRHLDHLLVDKNIKEYKPLEIRQQARADLYSDYKEFLVKNNRGDKSYETVMHDASLLEEVRHLRSNAKSSLEAGSLLITCDYYLYRFDWESARHNGQLACVLLPNMFWQILRPFIPPDQDFDKAFAETFALPEFRTIGSGASKASSKMLQILATYKDVPEETAFKLLSNDLLLDRLRATRNDIQFTDQVEMAFVEENKNLLEEKVSLERSLAEEKSKHEAEATARQKEGQKYKEEEDNLNKTIATIHEELGITSRAVEEHRQAADSAAQRAKKAEQSAHEALSTIKERKGYIQRVEQKAFNMSIVAGISLGVLIAIGFETAVYLISWKWLISHPYSYSLQGAFDLFLILIVIGLFVRKWRKWCWGAGVFSVLLIIIQMVGGPKQPIAK